MLPGIIRKLVSVLVLIVSIVLLQQAIVAANARIEPLARQSGLIRASGIDPAALFYTESPRALQAGRNVAERIAAGTAQDAPAPGKP